ATLREAIAVGIRYLSLTFAFSSVSSVEGHGEFRLVFDGTDLPADVRNFFVERELASTLTISREITGSNETFTAIHLQRPQPANVEAYVKLFGVVPVFGADGNYAVVARNLLDHALPQADTHTAALAEKQCAEVLDSWRSRGGVAGQV